MTKQAPWDSDRKHTTNAWELYPTENQAFLGRPQDWGNKTKWTHLAVTLQAGEYTNHVHIWYQKPDASQHEILEAASALICTILLPGLCPELCGDNFLDEDDFWDEDWGAPPEFFNEEDSVNHDDYFGDGHVFEDFYPTEDDPNNLISPM